MGDKRLLAAAVALIALGAAGVAVTSHLGMRWRYEGRPGTGGMMTPGRGGGSIMGGGGMMDREGMKEMMERMMGDVLPKGVRPEELPDPRSRGAKLAARYCSQCHDVPHPGLHTAADWPAVAERMFARMSMMAGTPMMGGVETPSPAERKAIAGYLKEHGRKG